MAVFAIAQAVLLVLATGYAGWSDVRFRTIPNWLCLLTLAIGLVGAFVNASGMGLLWHAAHFGVALLIGMALFAAGWWGGGDGKFYAAVAAWVPLQGFPKLAVAIALSGLVLVIVAFIARRGKLPPRSGTDKEGGAKGLPYGVAIGAGALITVLPAIIAP